MDFWPTRYSEKPRQFKKGKRRSDAQGETAADFDSRAYPVVEQGSVTAANLVRDGRRVEWTFLGQNDSGRRLHACHPPVTVFPATYPVAPRVPAMNAIQRANYGAQFLRTHYPDIDIAADVLHAEIMEDARYADSSAELNPYAGNKLAFITFSERTRRKSAYLAFPLGPTGRDLSISALNLSKRGHAIFEPSAKAAKTFDTPIDQIVGYHGNAPDILQGTYMAVRTTGSTHLIRVQREGSTPKDLSIDTLSTWTRSATDQRHIVDVIFPTLSSDEYASILAVTDHGQIYRCFADPQRSAHLLYAATVERSNDQLWRVARTSSADILLFMSSSTLSLIDTRSKSESLRLLTSMHRPLISVETTGVDHMIRVLTTDELTWFDERFSQKPLISYRHGRQKDRTLQPHTISFCDGPVTFLTSMRSNLITIYDVSQDTSGFIRMNTPAYALPSLGLQEGGSIGSAIIRHPSDTSDDSASILHLSSRGSIHRLDVSLAAVEEYAGNTHVWSQEVQDLAHESSKIIPEYGDLSEMVYNEVDLKPVVERIFELDNEDSSHGGEAVYNALDSMQSFWSTLDEPVEHMLTTMDVAFRSGNEPDAPSRTDFLTQNELNSTRGYRALVQHRIPVEQIAKQASWHHNIHSTINKFIPELSTLPEETSEDLKVHNLQIDDYRAGTSLRREGDAREQLTLDLSLSTDIYAPHPLQLSPSSTGSLEDDAFETMSRATEAMSIGVPEPPSVNFGFLRPDFNRTDDHYAEDKDGHKHKIEQPAGVRLLLKDWEIATDPESYVYYDPYGISGVGAPRPVRPTRLPPINETAFRPTQSQRAPPVVASSMPMAPPPIISSQPARAAPRANWQSQDVTMAPHRTGLYPSQDESQLQETFIPSTQVLPGPFGGRPAIKKKPVKKRIGGF